MFLEEISKEIIWRKNPEKIHQKTVPGIRFTGNTKRCFLKDNSHIHLLAAKKIVLKSAQKLFLKKLLFVSCTLETRVSLGVSFRVNKDTRTTFGSYLSSPDRPPPKSTFTNQGGKKDIGKI